MLNQWLLILLVLIASSSFGQNMNLSLGVVFDGEPYLAINPNNDRHIVVAWMGWVNLANRFQIKTKTSLDGGQTWSSAVELPHTVTGYSSADPCIAFNNASEVFISYIDFTGTTPPVTGGVYVCKSLDGGLSWESPKEVINTAFDGTKWPIDRPWMVIDQSNGPHAGNIYIASFNLNRTNPPYNPYLSVSSDSGNSFTTRYADTTGWLAGSLNPLPMCIPTVSSTGVLYASYPSYVLTQSLYTQSFLAVSTDGGNSLSHKKIITNNPPANLGNFPLAKKGAPIISNPANPAHLAFLYLSAETGDLDVYLIESFDAGDSWSTPDRLNDDPLMNNRMQDLVWADFDQDGDLVVSWRDRRNSSDSSYQTETEIWATYRGHDSADFVPNFQITSQAVSHNTDLEEAGNDFMCIQLQNDTLSATWGDARDGEINIWFQRMRTDGTILSARPIATETIPALSIFPNPTTSSLTIKGMIIEQIEIYDSQGKRVWLEKASDGKTELQINLEGLPPGSYILQVITPQGRFADQFIKQ